MSEDVFPGPALRPLRLQFGEQIIAGFESPGAGRPILLVHGNSSSSRIWQKQLQGPLGTKYRLITIDLPGHGASSPAANPEQDYSGPGYSACVAAIARELGLCGGRGLEPWWACRAQCGDVVADGGRTDDLWHAAYQQGVRRIFRLQGIVGHRLHPGTN